MTDPTSTSEAPVSESAVDPAAASAASKGSRTGETLHANVFDSPKERVIRYALGACALVSILTTLGIAAVLVVESAAFFQEVSIGEFLGSTQWTPQFADKHFGIWPLIAGTVLITVISALVSMPLGLASAIYLSAYAPVWLRKWLKPGIELLAGVPTVVYGYFALTFVTPLLQTALPHVAPVFYEAYAFVLRLLPFVSPPTEPWTGDLGVFNALSAGIVVGIMVIPMVASLSEDAIQAVPRSLWNGAYALGATKLEVVMRVVVPSAFSGIVASFILALSRAIGETMIVTLAAGATPKLTLDPTESIQTMTAFIVQMGKGDIAQSTIEYKSLFAVGLVLFLITLGMNILANRIVARYQDKY
ncbi:phosphate ABC transporter permease subunit PstC [Longibacter salinarum]|uniref:Phosphate transport system permease protein n=1 Tax=Longibacter salinarum TaxID=1850348 RepID=A0A2A8CUW3_9BACT|nr:phosphate ABC transporter permease subunit PstC [Longibacter salinarum]PEN12293.1 phosphate ABC transporter permease subunit PstC [Longibacter salinarum]